MATQGTPFSLTLLSLLASGLFLMGCDGDKIKALEASNAELVTKIEAADKKLDELDQARGKVEEQIGTTKQTMADYEKLLAELTPKSEEEAPYPPDLSAALKKVFDDADLQIKEVGDAGPIRKLVADEKLGSGTRYLEVSKEKESIFVAGTYGCVPKGGGVGAAVASFEASLDIRVIDGKMKKVLGKVSETAGSTGFSQDQACENAVKNLIEAAQPAAQKILNTHL